MNQSTPRIETNAKKLGKTLFFDTTDNVKEGTDLSWCKPKPAGTYVFDGEEFKEVERSTAPRVAGVIDREAHVAGVYDWGAGKTFSNNYERKEWMKSRNRICTND